MYHVMNADQVCKFLYFWMETAAVVSWAASIKTFIRLSFLVGKKWTTHYILVGIRKSIPSRSMSAGTNVLHSSNSSSSRLIMSGFTTFSIPGDYADRDWTHHRLIREYEWGVIVLWGLRPCDSMLQRFHGIAYVPRIQQRSAQNFLHSGSGQSCQFFRKLHGNLWVRGNV